jgi:hypothetical protein
MSRSWTVGATRSRYSSESLALDSLVDFPQVHVEVRRRKRCSRNQGTRGTQVEQVHSRHADEGLMSSIPWIWGGKRMSDRRIRQIPNWKRSDTGWNIPESCGEYIRRSKRNRISNCPDSTVSTIKYSNCSKRTVRSLPPENHCHHSLQYRNQREILQNEFMDLSNAPVLEFHFDKDSRQVALPVQHSWIRMWPNSGIRSTNAPRKDHISTTDVK